MGISNKEYKTILAPIDGSENSYRAASAAIDMAKRYNSELLFLYVSNLNQNLQLLGMYGASYPDAVAEQTKAAKLEAQSWFERILTEAQVASVRVRSRSN